MSDEGLYDLVRFVDERLEIALRERRSLQRAMALLLPAIAERVGVAGFVLRTFGEDLKMRVFSWPPALGEDEAVKAFLAGNEADHGQGGVFDLGNRRLVAQSLDVAGEWFGSAVFVVAAGPSGQLAVDDDAMVARLDAVCEQLDNYLFAIRASREKQRVTIELVRALQERVLSVGLAEAVRILCDNVGVRRLLIALRAEQSEGAPVHVEVFEGTECRVDTMAGVLGDHEIEGIERDARSYLAGTGRGLLERFGFVGAQEEVMIHGVRETTLVGKIVVQSAAGDFDTYDRDLLSEFGDFICQRVVDFNKEYRTLARSFRPDHVDRMLRTSDYVERYLLPREKEVAILYVDVSGFTRLCEQVLVDPRKIGRLVDQWGSEAVRILHEHGGVFDKMVGDCIIGLFGPPFYELDAGARLSSALDAAVAIRAMTNAMPEREEHAVLRAEGLGVSTGVSYSPLFVGVFGPNENFTGFSSGMNNTARLQAQAGRNEILVMNDAIARLPEGHAYRFGELRTGKAKNVAQPLEFRPLV
jgi:class 3 adenylate cyclase